MRIESTQELLPRTASVLEYGVRIGKLKANPLDGIEKLPTAKRTHLVAQQELDLAVEVGRGMGGAQHICALGLKTAWLCVKRSVEVRALSVGQMTEAGIVWKAAKRKRGTADKFGLIEWSPELRATVDEALAIRRYNVDFIGGVACGRRADPHSQPR